MPENTTPSYEAPAIVVVGSLHELTLGTANKGGRLTDLNNNTSNTRVSPPPR